MIKISILQGHELVQQRTTKSGVRYFQNAYVDLGGAFPQQIELSLRQPSDAKNVGDYELDISSFQIGRFKNLELNPFQINLKPLSSPRSISSKAS